MVEEMKADLPPPNTSSDMHAVDIAHYLTSQLASNSVLEFWRQNTALHPHISQLAHIHLSASSSYIPVKSMFSITGFIVNSRRSRLKTDKQHKISYVHDNHKFALVDMD